ISLNVIPNRAEGAVRNLLFSRHTVQAPHRQSLTFPSNLLTLPGVPPLSRDKKACSKRGLLSTENNVFTDDRLVKKIDNEPLQRSADADRSHRKETGSCATHAKPIHHHGNQPLQFRNSGPGRRPRRRRPRRAFLLG